LRDRELRRVLWAARRARFHANLRGFKAWRKRYVERIAAALAEYARRLTLARGGEDLAEEFV